jgi:hypothetical protein
MKPFENIDTILLHYTENLARFVYRLFGINNFKLAHLSLVLAAILGLVSAFFLSLHKPHDIFDLICALFVSLFGPATLWFLVVKKAIENYRPGHGNLERIKPERILQRVWLFFLSIVSLIRPVGEGPWNVRRILEVISWDLCFLSFFAALCFVAIEPEDPTDSLLKKGLKWLKGLFETSALPQPA